MLNLASTARPYLGAIVISTLLLTAGGIYSYTRMANGVYPEVTFPRIAVVAKVPDQDVATMDVRVTRPLEEAVTGVIGVTKVRSKTVRGGSELSIDFAPGTDMRRAEQMTWNRLGGKVKEFPDKTELVVEQMTPSTFPIVSVVLTGGDTASQLRDFAFYQLAPAIKTIPDVLYANVSGGDIREIEVIVDPKKLLEKGMSAADLADAIRAAGPILPAGLIQTEPLAYQLIVSNQSDTIRSLTDLVIAKNNQAFHIGDVAEVKLLHQDRVMSIGYNQEDAVVITVFRRQGGSTVSISRAIEALLEKRGLSAPIGSEAKLPPRNIVATVVYDQKVFVESAVYNVRDAILIGGLFSILILFAFLRSWRATLISALAIPTTLAITFLFLHWTGETLNLMSLGGLAVAIGLIIDDTVVVIENISRHLTPDAPGHGGHGTALAQTAVAVHTGQNGTAPVISHAPPPDPVDAASGEITGAVVGSTMTTVLVFLPLAFIVGVYGQFFASLAWSLAIAVLVSMVISLTLVPVFASRFLAGKPMPAPGRIYNFFAYIYEVMLSVALRFPWVTLFISLAAVGVGVLLFTGIPDYTKGPDDKGAPPPPLVKGLETGLMPAMDEGAMIVDYFTPSGTTLQETERRAKDIEKVLARNPDVRAWVRRTGAENGLFATQTSRGDIQVVLRAADEDPWSLIFKPVRPPFADVEKELKDKGLKLEDAAGRDYIRNKYRRRTLGQIKDEIEDELKDSYGENQLKFEIVQIMQDELNDLSGANKPIEVKIFGPDHNQLRLIAADVAEAIEKKKASNPGIKEVNSNVRQGNPDLMIELDSFELSKLGLDRVAVSRQLKAMFQGDVALEIPESSQRLTGVRVRYSNEQRFGKNRFDPAILLNKEILLPDAKGTSLSPTANLSRLRPLSSLLKNNRLSPKRTPDEQWRENQQPAIFVTAELSDGAGLGSVVADVRQAMKGVSMPAEYRWEMGGHFLRMEETFQSLEVVMVVAILLVYIMLAFQFRSVVLPLLIFLTQPLSLVSGLIALWLTNTPLNVSSYMGAILLIGLDMKNGILLVEYIQQLRLEGMELKPALLLAGRVRFRPILMTSLAAILGLLPLAFGIGPGAQMQQPLAIMVIGGLTANMLFTRMVIPVGYLVLESFRSKKEKPKVTPPTPVAPIVKADVALVGS